MPKYESCAVLRLSRIPIDFGEREIFAYMKQFGRVHAVHVPRSRKTLRSRGYAFVKVPQDIAPMIVSTLDGVLNFNKIMKCEIVPDPNWSAFRRKPLMKSSRTKEIKRQTAAALARTTHKSDKSPSDSATTKNPAQRRRTRNFEKRLKLLQQANPSFVFQTKC
ncbi:unnamed protein product [Dicrocoelium dendriticum]|nr:unnamed protein product [Dicrocoelium dendriticum]